MTAQPVLLLAARGETWGGATVGIVAAAGFVGFAAWILIQRLRHGRHRDDS